MANKTMLRLHWGMDTWKEFARSEEIHADYLQKQLQNCNRPTPLVCNISMSLGAPASLLLQVSPWEVHKCLPCLPFPLQSEMAYRVFKRHISTVRGQLLAQMLSELKMSIVGCLSVVKLLGHEMLVASTTLWLIQLLLFRRTLQSMIFYISPACLIYVQRTRELYKSCPRACCRNGAAQQEIADSNYLSEVLQGPQ